MYQDDRSTCRAIVIIITPFVFFKMSLTCRDNFFVVKNVMTFKTCLLVRIGPYAQDKTPILQFMAKSRIVFFFLNKQLTIASTQQKVLGYDRTENNNISKRLNFVIPFNGNCCTTLTYHINRSVCHQCRSLHLHGGFNSHMTV